VFYVENVKNRLKIVNVEIFMNKAEQLFEKVGFWNMSCVKISEKQQLEVINNGM